MVVTGSASPPVILPDTEAPGQRRRTGRGHIDSYGHGRVCEAGGCTTKLSRYNPGSTCGLHDAAVLSTRRWTH